MMHLIMWFVCKKNIIFMHHIEVDGVNFDLDQVWDRRLESYSFREFIYYFIE